MLGKVSATIERLPVPDLIQFEPCGINASDPHCLFCRRAQPPDRLTRISNLSDSVRDRGPFGASGPLSGKTRKSALTDFIATTGRYFQRGE
jgi:hypothetical protein